MLQGAGFTGAAAGVNLARDYRAGLGRPPARLPGAALGPAGLEPCWPASLASLIPATFVLGIGFELASNGRA